MYRIAICDDDKEFIDYIKKIIIELGMNYNNTEYYEYESGELFINALKKYRIFFNYIKCRIKKHEKL